MSFEQSPGNENEEELELLEERKRTLDNKEDGAVFTPEDRQNQTTSDSITEALLNTKKEIKEVKRIVKKESK